MALVLSGKEVAAKIKSDTKATTDQLRSNGLTPRLQIIRVGERTDDVYYQKSLEKACADTGIDCKVQVLEEQIGQKGLEEQLTQAAQDPLIHGILLFSPLPKGYDLQAAVSLIPVAKDVDCLNPLSSGAIFTGCGDAYPPCTAAAVMEMLKYYEAKLEGRSVTIVGRSLVVGKPLAMLLLGQNATVTIAHSYSEDLPAICRRADVVIAAAGRAKMFKGNFFTPGQVAIDVGINDDPDNPGHICGDIEYETAEQIVAAISPVPGGVGSITSAILCAHVADACAKSRKQA
ncbi:MAG: bifunctional 5,10-methylenetetrahydrofolate dehydrogenase/5,10-methenyltetrahydrofolate cyclohydrolase [Firmicutes bacterium]|nr:bifunctional 5,10-methylenetetrahydrofolate dehydrogenase/5,10-methenyltetrahydrofolate cyclohydrolase [Bacillota bacterium]